MVGGGEREAQRRRGCKVRRHAKKVFVSVGGKGKRRKRNKRKQKRNKVITLN